MTSFGDFTADAYDALRQAYANQLNDPLAEEQAGYEVAGQNYGLETIDARNDYLKSTGLWTYPSGHSDYEKPNHDTLITALQTRGGEDEDDIDALIDELLGEETDDGEE